MFLPMTVTSTPLLKDLYECITPQYAADWKVMGTLLGLSTGELKIIEHDNYHKAVSCCNAMLEKWLDVDAKATWEKLLRVVESHAVSTGQIFNTKGKVYTDLGITSYFYNQVTKYITYGTSLI